MRGRRLLGLVLTMALVTACSSAPDDQQPTSVASPVRATPDATSAPPTMTPTQPTTPTTATPPGTTPPTATPPTPPATASATHTTGSPPPLADFPPQPAGVPWPTEEWVEAEWPADVDRAPVDSATDTALADGAAQRVRAVVIVHGGAIVFERYSPNPADGPDVVMPSFSVAKSITSALIGILVRDRRLDTHDPAPVPEWHADPDDPRAAITLEQMLHMSTGIDWTDGAFQPGTDLYAMLRSSDMAGYAAAQPLSDEPGTTFEYNTGTSMLLARIVGREIGGSTQEVRAFFDDALFGPIGMSPVRTGFDEAGTFQGGFAADSTARGFARFGLLYLRGGEWDGTQILPREWVEYTRTPSPANPEYGAHWWLDRDRPGVTYALGAQGQVITVDPAHDLVIVQLSTVGGSLPLAQTEAILGAFAARSGTGTR